MNKRYNCPAKTGSNSPSVTPKSTASPTNKSTIAPKSTATSKSTPATKSISLTPSTCKDRVMNHCNRTPSKYRERCQVALLKRNCNITAITNTTTKPVATAPKDNTNTTTKPVATTSKTVASAPKVTKPPSGPNSPMCVSRVNSRCGRISNPRFRERCRMILTRRRKECN